MQETYTWRTVNQSECSKDRAHIRIVVDVFGRPLIHFLTTKELVMAIRDALIGMSTTISHELRVVN